MSRLILVLMVLFGVNSVRAADTPSKDARAKRPPNPSLSTIEDQPGLPRVLLIGDSISMGYTLPTRELLKGKANVHRIPTNGATTAYGLAQIDQWLGDQKWDVIHFNWGLHDLKYIGAKGERIDPAQGKVQVPLEQYESNLRQLVQRMKKSGAKLIWCTTTPVPEGTDGRIAGEEEKYNAVAEKIMHEEQVTINDLCGFAKPQLKKIGLPANVHYSPEGYKVLATRVAEVIQQALAE